MHPPNDFAVTNDESRRACQRVERGVHRLGAGTPGGQALGEDKQETQAQDAGATETAEAATHRLAVRQVRAGKCSRASKSS
jgi:hypothetical protein